MATLIAIITLVEAVIGNCKTIVKNIKNSRTCSEKYAINQFRLNDFSKEYKPWVLLVGYRGCGQGRVLYMSEIRVE